MDRWHRLDQLVTQYVEPVMLRAGFNRLRAREFILEGQDGWLVLVKITGYSPIPSLVFRVEWSAIPRVLREFHQDGRRSAIPKLEWGLIENRLPVPEGLRISKGMPHEWIIRTEDDWDAVGSALVDVFQNRAIPLWQHCLSVDYLATANWREFVDETSMEFNQSSSDGAELRDLILYIDDRDPGELEDLLDTAETRAGDDYGGLFAYLRRRLAARSDASLDE